MTCLFKPVNMVLYNTENYLDEHTFEKAIYAAIGMTQCDFSSRARNLVYPVVCSALINNLLFLNFVYSLQWNFTRFVSKHNSVEIVKTVIEDGLYVIVSFM